MAPEASDDGKGQATGPPGPAALDQYRGYLLALARTSLPAALSRKLDPSDVVQQTLLRACRGWDHFRGSTDPELAGWLRQVLRNTLVDVIREYGGPTRDANLERSLDATLADSSAAIDRLAASSVGRDVARRDEVARLLAALEALPRDQRAAVELHHLARLTVSEVAIRLGRTEASVAGLLRRALRTLRTSFDA